MSNAYLDDDGGPVVAAVGEAGAPGALFVRVGSVWDDEDKRTEPGVWVEWQDEYQKSSMHGPLLLTPAVWRALATAVEMRLRARKAEPLWKRYRKALLRLPY